MRRLTLFLALFLAFGGARPTGASNGNHLPQQSLIRRYVVPYETQGQSLWGVGEGIFDTDYLLGIPNFHYDVPVIGGEFDPGFFISTPIGAFLGVRLATQDAGFRFKAHADVGTVDVSCPIDVVITYPDPATLNAGDTFQISTSYEIDPSARIQTHSPDFRATLDAEGTVSLSAHVKVDVIVTILDKDLFTPFQQSLNFNLFDSQDYINSVSGDFTIIPDILTGNIHKPQLDASAGRNTLKQLVTQKSDTFLSFKGDMTNLIAQTLDLPPWNGPYGGSVYGGNFQLLDFYGLLGVGISQSCTYQPMPTITFRTSDPNQTVTVTAGQPATFRLPLSGILTVTPEIRPGNQFSNNTTLTLSPSLDFEPLHITGSGHALGYDIFSFNIHPFGGPVSIGDTFDILSANPSFELSGVQAQTQDPYTIDATDNPLQLVEITPNRTTVSEKDLTLTGKARGYVDGVTFMAINGQQLQPLFPQFHQGTFSVTIPCFYLTHSGILSLTLVTPGMGTTPLKISNAVDLLVQAPTLQPSQIGSLTATQDKQIMKLPSLGGGPIHVTAQTTRFHADMSNCQAPVFIPGTASFLWDHTPVPTTVQASFPDTPNGMDVQYTITASIPESLLVNGGPHTLSLLNPGPEAVVSDITQITVANPVPVLREFGIVNPMQEEEKHYHLSLLGSAFTPSSVVYWEGQPLPTKFVSPGQLLAKIRRSELKTAGKHPITVVNPAPVGGASNILYDIVEPSLPFDLSVNHNLYRTKDNPEVLQDLIVLQTLGTRVVTSLHISEVQILLPKLKGIPPAKPDVTFAYPTGGGSNSLFVGFPVGSGEAGETAVLKITGEADGRAFTLSTSVTLP